MVSKPETTALAKANWDADRDRMRTEDPSWPFPAWSRAPSWRKRPYLLAAKLGKHPDEDQPDAE